MKIQAFSSILPQRLSLSVLAAALLLSPGIGVRAQLADSPALGKPLHRPPIVTDASSVTITIDATASNHAISPLIYGAAYATSAAVADLNLAVNRYGGNNTSRYNWRQNADNRGSDYYFESIGDTSAQAGERGDTFIRTTRQGNRHAQPMLTIPMVGYVATLGANRAKQASFSVAKYGAQTSTDYYFPDAGNGVLAATGQNITGNNPLDANIAANSSFQQAWVQHIVANWHTAAKGGLKYYLLDNEPSIWYATHRDVHPNGASMDEVANKMIDYAGRIKTTDPSALVVGPEEWGWTGYFYSGEDQQYGNANGYSNLPDRSSHGNVDYIPYLLTQMQQHQTSTGQRLLDVLSVHYYPQGNEYYGGTDSATELLRNQSTRSLWDPNYVDQSYIATQVQLIPRLKGWVNTYYPGTLTAITEYSWGADTALNGATAQADILGIFGREGLDLASRWTCPDSTTPTYQAFKIYRNYDGHNNGFGDTSASAVAPLPDDVSAFASVRSSDGALTVMVVDKDLTGSAALTLNVAHFAGGTTAQVWQFGNGHSAITRLADTAYSGGALSLTVPAQSVTLFVLPRTAAQATVRIPVTLASYLGNAVTVPLTVEVRMPGTTTALDQFTATLSGGVLSFPTARIGTFDIALQGPTFLRKVVKSVAFTASGATVSAITLTNGDVDGDNTVGLPDYTAVLRALGATSTSANWNPAADLNGDGIVNAADQAIVTANLRQVGDP